MNELDYLKTPLEGGNLIEASAGTGKTYSITLLVLRLILEKDLDLNQILVVTFTEAATAEIKERILQTLRSVQNYLLNNENLPENEKPSENIIKILEKIGDNQKVFNSIQRALLQADEASVFTIHGFCSKVLADHAFETGSSFNLELLTDSSEIIQQTLEDFWRTSILTLEHPYLLHLASEALSFKELSNSLTTLLNHPKVEVLKEDITDEEVNTISEKVGQVWQAQKEEIKTLIQTSNVLKRNKENFKLEVLDPLFQETEEYLEKGFLKLKLAKKYSTENMQDQIDTRKAKQIDKSEQILPEHKFFALCSEFVKKSNRWILSKKGDFLSFALDHLKKRKAELGVRTFEDLLIDVHNALFSPNGESLISSLRKKYRATLIDEFQDTDSLQYEIFEQIFGQKENLPFFMIGDPKQAIYRFRGGDIHTFLKANKNATNCYTLTANYRSQPKLIDAFNKIFSIENPFLTPGIQYEKIESKVNPSPLTKNGSEDKPVIILKADKKDEQIKQIASTIQQLLSEEVEIGATDHRKKLQASDIAILVKNNDSMKDYKRALARLGIPSVTSSANSVFSGKMAKHLYLLLKTLAEGLSPSNINALLISVFFNLSPKQIEELAENSDKWTSLTESISEASQNWVHRGIAFALEQFFIQNKIYPHLIHMPDGKRLVTDLRHLIEILHEKEIIIGRFPLRLLVHYEQLLANPSKSEDEERLESDENAVQILSIHKSKGLQFPIVFVPSFQFSSRNLSKNGILYHDPDNHKNVFDFRFSHQETARKHEENEILDENQRLFYVALTRAQYQIYVGWTKSKQYPSPYHFFLDAFVAGEKHHSNIEILTYDETEQGEEHQEKNQPVPQQATFREFSRTLTPSWEIGSYSSLVVNNFSLFSTEDRKEETSTPEGMFAFPRGPRPGEALHEILEKIDFRAFSPETTQKLIQTTLNKYQIDGSIEAVTEMIQNLLATPLVDEGKTFSLQELSGSYRVPEMEFYIRSKTLNVRELNQLLADRGVRLHSSAQGGFLKGFIDLFFKAPDGRYYLIDWKSNHLGDHFDDYTSDALSSAMKEHQYTFQLLLYTLAIRRHLQHRLPNFDYERDFGGAYYIFLRGISPNPTERTGRTGIYFEKPSLTLLNEIEELIDGGSAHDH